MAARVEMLRSLLSARAELPNVLDIEREAVPFDVTELAAALHGGADRLATWRAVQQQVARDQVFLAARAFRVDSARVDERAQSARFVQRLISYFRTDTPAEREARDFITAAAYPGAHGRLSNHTGLFEPAIRLLGSEEQVRAWDAALRDFGVLGCFALSEVAHASNARGVETTATYDASRGEFIITSPRAESGKFWIGSAASSATHAVVYAHLIVDGHAHGLNAFIVPLRDMRDGSPLPHVSLRDTGPKMGRNALDNGYILFSGVRIPRGNMLSRYTQVEADGTVAASPLQALALGALVGGRIIMVHASAWTQAMALTICVRYMLVRRQFKPVEARAAAGLDARLEQQVLDYPVQLRRIVPLIASTYAYHCADLELKRMHVKLQSMLESLSAGDTASMEATGAWLKQVHAFSAGLKAEASWTAYHAVDTARQACGGHGYSALSGLPSLFADYAVFVTWEGDNTLMSLQCARFLMKLPAARDLAPDTFLHWLANDTGDERAHDSTVALLQRVRRAASACIACVKGMLHQRRKAGHVDADEWCGHELVQLSRLVSKLFAAWALARWLGLVPSTSPGGRASLSPSSVAVLSQLLCIFLMEMCEAAVCIDPGCVSAADLSNYRRSLTHACVAQRPHILHLVEAFDFDDFMLNTCIGTRDGDVYGRYLARVNAQTGDVAGTPSYWGATIGAALAAAPSSSHPPAGYAVM